MSTLLRKTPMNPGNGFQNRGGGFQRRDRETVALSEEVGEGHGSSFGFSKKAQTRGAAFQDEVGEGVTGSFGVSKASQTRNAGKFQDEVGEGLSKGFGKRTRAVVAAYNEDRARKVPTLDDPSRYKWGEEVGEGAVSMPKPEAKRNQALLDMARGRMCMLQAPYTLHHDVTTTVACHGNSHKFGKAKGRKAQDFYSAWGCFECHSWLDSSSATSEEKERVFHFGMFRQMLAWEQIAVSESEPAKFRNAARWALDHLEAEEYDPRAALIELDSESK